MANKVKTTKANLVKQHLIEKKEITSLDAIKLYGATRLSAIIFNLRDKKFAITTIPVKIKDKYGNECTFANYKLLKVPSDKPVNKRQSVMSIFPKNKTGIGKSITTKKGNNKLA